MIAARFTRLRAIGCKQRKRLAESFRSQFLKGTPHGTIGSYEQRHRDEELGVVYTECQLICGDLAVLKSQDPCPAVIIERQIASVQLFVRNAGSVQHPDLQPEVCDHIVVQGCGVKSVKRVQSIDVLEGQYRRLRRDGSRGDQVRRSHPVSTG